VPENELEWSSKGVVIGFVISYRASNGYEQYLAGRTAWSDVVKNTQGLMRLIWFHVPLRMTPKTADELAKPIARSRSKEEMETVMAEKRMALDLLEGYGTVTWCEGPSPLISALVL
jgi:putative membrane protein